MSIKLKSQLKGKLKRKRINVFFVFLILSFVILIFSKLSKEHTNTVAFNIDKINIPEEIIVINDSNTVLNMTLKTHGFKWLSFYLKKPKITIDFKKEIDKNDSSFVWNTSKNFSFIAKQFGEDVEVLDIYPNTLDFKFDVNAVKKIPVVLNADIQFSSGYDVSEPFTITPDSIEVIGPNILVSQIKNIKTEPLKMLDVKTDIEKIVQLKLPENNTNLKFLNQTVNLSAKVEKFTEGRVKVPVTVINIPNNRTIKYFPKTVDVTYYTSLNNFKTVEAKDFQVVCDFSKIASNQSYLLPEISKSPSTVKHVKINQQHIEFIIVE
ncbi:YbbR-like domain-containing protein [Oceanihabitans sp. IOP_32]|uniref:CdaR family protein n=1 Tax=Oceanihabitans sp. IOP_32 TaxID=2529032 RepID=UPI001293B76F|nr:CdaR family protein [Oceanihabitans sp. IOP_32]QFZ55928.1 YbbR-like domain-containing protein [Oceanihabitans sp. IOP_32]